jgi:hypothetical protein
MSLTMYLEAVLEHREADLERALTSMRADDVTGKLIDTDLEILDLVESESEA